MSSPDDQSVTEMNESHDNSLARSPTDASQVPSGSLPMAPSTPAEAPRRLAVTSRFLSSTRFSPATTVPTTGLEPSARSSSGQHLSTSEPATPKNDEALAKIKNELSDSSDEDEDTKPPPAKRSCRWHPPLTAPSEISNMRERQRSIVPSPPGVLRARSPRANAIFNDYKPDLSIASAINTVVHADEAYENHVQATGNVYIARIERLRAREDLQEAILELDRFKMDLARETLEMCRAGMFDMFEED